MSFNFGNATGKFVFEPPKFSPVDARIADTFAGSRSVTGGIRQLWANVAFHNELFEDKIIR
jgi:hypothetical protein